MRELNGQLTVFQQLYNTQRLHKAIGRRTPHAAYMALEKLTPVPQPQSEYRVRNDTVDKFGKLTLRYAGALRHLGMGITYSGVPVRMIIDDTEVTVIDRKTGEILRYFKIDPSKNYQEAISILNR